MSSRHVISRALLVASAFVLQSCGVDNAGTPVLAAVPASVSASTNTTLTGVAGKSVAALPSVIVKDANGGAVAGASVVFAVASGGGSITGATQATNASGIATVGSWTLGSVAGINTLTATVGSLPVVAFTATGTVGAAAVLTRSAGDAQNAAATTTVAVRPSVLVRDAGGNPVAGVTVVFTVGAGGGTVTSATQTTDAVGLATVGSWKLGSATGANTLVASSAGLASVTFTATASATTVVPEPPAGTRIVVGPVTPTLSVGLTQQMLAVVQNANGRPVDNLIARWTSSDPAVASISTLGLITGLKAGITTLTAAVGSVKASATLTVQTSPVTSALLLEHRDVVSTVFWVGEGADASNEFISNSESAFDAQWQQHYGGVDSPKNRRGYLPANFTPKENPFYFALPYSDWDDDGNRKANATRVIPWATARAFASTESMVKDRWVRVTSRKSNVTCYAQWEDAGPGVYDDLQYVFGSSAPSNPFVLDGLALSSAIDLSPATRDCLQITDDVFRVDWQFVEEANVPPGNWKQIITRRN